MLAVATVSGDTAGRGALAQLCGNYRPPVVAFLRNRGLPPEEAEDTAQDFFLNLLESRAWRRADRARGRFRTFMLGALVHVHGHNVRHGHAEKRGAGQTLLSLNALADDGFDPPDAGPDACLFDREWALHALSQALGQLEEEFAATGRSTEFSALRAFLPGATIPPSCEEVADRLNLPLNTVHTKIRRIRARLQELVRAGVARTVSAPHEIDDEIAHLRAVLSGRTMVLPP